MTQDPRQLAFKTLRAVQRGAFADVALDQALRQGQLNHLDRRLATELVYGTIRRQRTLDALIDQFAKRKSSQQPPDLRLLLHLGFYQLRYLHHIPAAAAVSTTVDLVKQNGLAGLAGFVNGLLRQYLRLAGDQPHEFKHGVVEQAKASDPLQLPDDPVERLGILHSYPDWIVQVWVDQIGLEQAELLCDWFNQPPAIDLRVNLLKATIDQVEEAMQAAGLVVQRMPPLPQTLRLTGSVGPIRDLPGFETGWWVVQDSSAQLVSHVLDPQPGETVIDACAAPGGKTTHMAELMGDQGVVWGCDRYPSRLKKLEANAQRLGLHSIQICAQDSRHLPQFADKADRVLLDAPCSGLGTLNRHADARWRQTPTHVQELSVLQEELLLQAATWVKPNGVLIYSTCTLHPAENEQLLERFLGTHPTWHLDRIRPDEIGASFATPSGWIKVWPHHQQMDGFFMVRLRHGPARG